MNVVFAIGEHSGYLMVGTNKILCTPSSWLKTDELAGWERVALEVLMGIAAQDGTRVGDADVELVGLVGLVIEVRI